MSLHRMSIEFLLNSDQVPKSSSDLARKGSNVSGLERQASTPNSEQKHLRRFWTEEEDELLRSLASTYGAKKWATLALYFKGRTASQLRCRWAYAVSNGRSNRPFSAEEDRFILATHASVGNRWTLIAHMMEDRLGNDVKNRLRLLHRHRKHNC
mmetsp:Transcript_7352/g.15711  ORF Transcript_7352/g.15711 Transcript_7352/m.15711 type:complete len:154 (+) Transcript_7352:2-463(+)